MVESRRACSWSAALALSLVFHVSALATWWVELLRYVPFPVYLVEQDASFAGESAIPGPLRAVLSGHQLHLFGQYVIASRYSLRKCGDVAMPDGDEAKAGHYARCELFVHGTAVTVISAHLASPRRGLNAARREGLEGVADWNINLDRRLAQARRMVQDLADAPRPLILGGDLNAPEHSPVVQSLLRLPVA